MSKYRLELADAPSPVQRLGKHALRTGHEVTVLFYCGEWDDKFTAYYRMFIVGADHRSAYDVIWDMKKGGLSRRHAWDLTRVFTSPSVSDKELRSRLNAHAAMRETQGQPG